MTEVEALAKYTAGKETLEVLLRERDVLLDALGGFSWARGVSSVQFVVDLDLNPLRDLVDALGKVSGDIHDLVGTINAVAALCDKPSIEMGMGVQPGARV